MESFSCNGSLLDPWYTFPLSSMTLGVAVLCTYTKSASFASPPCRSTCGLDRLPLKNFALYSLKVVIACLGIVLLWKGLCMRAVWWTWQGSLAYSRLTTWLVAATPSLHFHFSKIGLLALHPHS